MSAEKRKTLEIFELLLTAEIYNRSENLTEDDLPPKIRKYYFDPVIKGVERPLRVTLKAVEKISGVERIRQIIEENPLVVFHEIGFHLTLMDFEEGAQWFATQRPLYLIKGNPVLAYFYEKDDSMNVSYAEVREQNQPFSADRELIEAKIRKLCADKKEAEDLLKLATIKAPEDVRDRLDDLILTAEQRESVILKVCEGFKFEEIASILDTPASTIKSRVYTALEAMRVVLAPLPDTHGARGAVE